LLLVDRANYLVRIEHFDPLDRLNIRGRNLTLFVGVNCYRARFVLNLKKIKFKAVDHQWEYPWFAAWELRTAMTELDVECHSTNRALR